MPHKGKNHTAEKKAGIKGIKMKNLLFSLILLSGFIFNQTIPFNAYIGSPGIIYTGSITIDADSDDNGSGEIVFQIGGSTKMTLDNDANFSVNDTMLYVSSDSNAVGVGINVPKSLLHLFSEDRGVAYGHYSETPAGYLTIEAQDARILLASENEGGWGSIISFAEIDGGVYKDQWSVGRRTTNAEGRDTASFNISYGTSSQTPSNLDIFRIEVDGTLSINDDGSMKNLYNLHGTDNLFIGTLTGNVTSTGTGLNLGVGIRVFQVLSSGTENTGFGINAGQSVTSGIANTHIGFRSGQFVLTAYGNTSLGSESLRYNVTGITNTAVGYRAMYGTSTESQSANTAVGYAVFFDIEEGADNNSGLGSEAGANLTTGDNNSLFGKGAGVGLTTGSNNILLGVEAGFNLTTGSSNIIIGVSEAASAVGVSNELNIGNAIKGNLSTGDITFTRDIIVPSPVVPANASATGVTGTISWDASYIYICIATNTWERAAIASW